MGILNRKQCKKRKYVEKKRFFDGKVRKMIKKSDKTSGFWGENGA